MASPANQVDEHRKQKEVTNQHTTVPRGVKNVPPDSSNEVSKQNLSSEACGDAKDANHSAPTATAEEHTTTDSESATTQASVTVNQQDETGPEIEVAQSSAGDQNKDQPTTSSTVKQELPRKY